MKGDKRYSFRDEVRAIKVGTAVVVGGKIQATVVAVCIHSDRVTYQCSWWDGNARKCEWLESFEVEPEEKTAPPIGFTVREPAPEEKP